ncbi:glycosyltransferase family 87 protein [Ralstonia soli]|uniref:DUF2029 domain-containing protein n=1 Tax=Ralstonia soli TaxID=2953896 RepID=A0ABT1AJF2_9RALS|nr:glycosyltransferase family 87 protein [Ralstonia soli]MCO5398526.1 DUF2029 domain-containing protein [Ralstonia soli]
MKGVCESERRSEGVMPPLRQGSGTVNRLALYASVAVVIQILALSVWVVRFYVLEDWTAPMVGFDFAVFWSASRVALEHGAASVFSMQLLQPIEVALWHEVNYAPWPYPPTFLLAVLPFGFMPFGKALALYSTLGTCVYGLVVARIARRIDSALRPFLIAFPGVFVALGLGQNSLFTVGAAGAALLLLEADSMLAGVCIAMLAVKPQFGVLFPLALLCGRYWKELAVSASLTLVFVGATVQLLGFDAWEAFASYLPQFNRMAVEHGGDSMWIGMPTVFAFSRSVGMPVKLAYLVHGFVAAPAVVIMAWLWAKRARFELRATAFVVATLMVQPYIMFYDLAWLILPMVFLMRDGKVLAFSRAEWVVLVAAWCAPVQGVLAGYIGHYLQIVPVVLLALLAMVVRRHFMTSEGQAAFSRAWL